jgi:hypothetical protein
MSDGTPDFTGALDLDRDRPNPYARDFQQDRLTCAEIERITFAFYKRRNITLRSARSNNAIVFDLASEFKMPLGIIRSVVDTVAISNEEREKQELIDTLQKCAAFLSRTHGSLHAEVLTVLEKYQ